MTCPTQRRDPLLECLTPGQRAKLKRIADAYAANDPAIAPVVTGCGGDYTKSYTPKLRRRGTQHRVHQPSLALGFLAGVAFCAAVAAILVVAHR